MRSEYRQKTHACGNIENATSIDELIKGKGEGNSCDETCPTFHLVSNMKSLNILLLH